MDFDDLPHLNLTLSPLSYDCSVILLIQHHVFFALYALYTFPENVYIITFVTTRLCILDEILYRHTPQCLPFSLGMRGHETISGERARIWATLRPLPQRIYLAMFMFM